MANERESYEAEVLPGLASFARAELAATGRAVLGPRPTDEARADAVPFAWRGGRAPLHRLRTVTAVDRIVGFDVPRPKALLGDAHFRRAVAEVEAVRAAAPAPMRSFRLEAAGRDSSVLKRLRAALVERLRLPDEPEAGELRLRLRPGPGGAARGGWELLIRLTPRPLSARAWRACNRPGGLNACVAAAAWALAGHAPGERVLNAMCGSGTLLLERAALGPAARLLGIDADADAIACAEANRAAAVATPGLEPAATIELRRGDATRTGLPDAAFDAIVADPPWGDAVADRAAVEALHPALLAEAARLLVPGGRLLVVTHALRAFDAALREAGEAWVEEREVRVLHGGHRPALRLLRRSDAPGPASPPG